MAIFNSYVRFLEGKISSLPGVPARRSASVWIPIWRSQQRGPGSFLIWRELKDMGIIQDLLIPWKMFIDYLWKYIDIIFLECLIWELYHPIWLVVTGTWLLFSHSVGNVIISIDFHIFQGGSNHQPDRLIDIIFLVKTLHTLCIYKVNLDVGAVFGLTLGSALGS